MSMGDGGVACAPSQHTVERFPNPEPFCNGGSAVFACQSFNKMRKRERDEVLERKQEERKQEVDLEKVRKLDGRSTRGVPEKKCDAWTDKNRRGGDLEPGEWRNWELEKGEIPPDNKLRKDELERGEFVPDKWCKYDVEKGEIVQEREREREREREQKEKSDRGDERSVDDSTRKKDSTRSDRDHQVRPLSNWEGSFHSNGKNHLKENGSNGWTKWPDSDSCSMKHREDLGDRIRRISGESNRSSTHSDKVNRSSSSAASRAPLTGKYSSSRHREVSIPSRGSHERTRRSPGRPERSPRDRARNHALRDRSPERSPLERARNYAHRDRSPCQSEQSLHDHTRRRHDQKERNSGYCERSPHDHSRHHDHRDRSSSHGQRSPHDRTRVSDHREQNKRSGVCEKQQNSKNEERLGCKDSVSRESNRNSSRRHSNDNNGCQERNNADKSVKEFELQSSLNKPTETSPPLPPPPPPPPHPPPPPPPPPQNLANWNFQEPPSMEEDMDICDTPPHVSTQADVDLGKWYFLDHFGVERGPSKLEDLKILVKNGHLLSDHLIKHSDSDRWVTVENAVSPMVPLNLPSIVSDTVTQMVSPPDAPGNLLEDADINQEASVSVFQQELHLDDGSVTHEVMRDYHVNERVEGLLEGYPIIYGKELESLGGALNAHFVYMDLERWCHTEDFTRSRPCAYDFLEHSRDAEDSRMIDGSSKEMVELKLGACFEREDTFRAVDFSDWFDGRWSCMGGDWKRNDESTQDKFFKKRQVLNEGYPLCLMPKSRHVDPRLDRKDDLYHTSRNRKFDLPPWAFSWTEDKNEGSNDSNKSMLAGRSAQIKPQVPRIVKGTMLPVVRINACVVKDYVSSEPRGRVRSGESYASWSSKLYSTNSGRNLFPDRPMHSKKLNDPDSHSLHRCRTILNTPKDHVCKIDELSLDLGDWCYLDGSGHERGPWTYAEIQELTIKGTIMKKSSVFRKDDNLWIPVTSHSIVSETIHLEDEKRFLNVDSSSEQYHSASTEAMASQSFNSKHPQFIGYTRGKLHELVMKSYKNREFAAAINEVLDPWISLKQPKKEIDKHCSSNSSITKSSAILTHDLSADKFWNSEDSGNGRPAKRARLLFDESDADSEKADDRFYDQQHSCSFDDLCGNAASFDGSTENTGAKNESWGQLNSHILARIFHFLRKDIKSLLFSAATCRKWNNAVRYYKSIANHVDLSTAGTSCTDSMLRSILSGYDKKNITSLVLTGCSNISSSLLEEVLRFYPSMSSVDIRGCGQFKGLKSKFQNMKWLKGYDSLSSKNIEEPHLKTRTLKHLTENNSLSKGFRAPGSYLDPDYDSNDHSFDMKDSIYSCRQGYYKGKSLRDAKKSSAALSRTTHMNHLVRRNQYKKMEKLISTKLKDIMRGNTFEFFIPKVAQIEDRMRSGYYFRAGLVSVKEDIRRMCRDALKARNRGAAGEMHKIMMSFIQLLKNLDEIPKSSMDRNEAKKSLKNDSDAGLNSSASKYGKKLTRAINEKRSMSRGNNAYYLNDGIDERTYASERKIRRSLSKLKRRNMDSESESSDDLSEDVRGESGLTESDTESDLELAPSTEDAKKSGYFMVDEAIDTISDVREWGARMTEASLVPPITRKYEVIDKYLIIADEDEVRKKMQVALPDDYAEKILVRNSGKEESDMQLPEVKEYKPRKMLGEEVIEQEVYGIDPYTHNLLLDSLPEDPEWSLTYKQEFIEEVLLRTLNKQIRHFTGTGNTPMVYPLQPVLEKILRTAEEESDSRVMKLCIAILRAMRSRSDDKYVAYRKGLGVVCNKEEGFDEDDFVVEFLGEVYPVWKWYEKQDGIKFLQDKKDGSAPEFYNINLERPKGDRDGYDLVVVDAMHKANYASRICHSCKPNCEAKVTAVNGQYQIGLYTLRPIIYGEELTFDYNSVTESKEECEASVCLCGSQFCRGSYLNLTGEGAFQMVLRDCHGILDRHKFMLLACEADSISQEDYMDLGKAGIGASLLSGLPDWLVVYAACLVRFINYEKRKLPEKILKHNLEEKRRFFPDIRIEDEKQDAENQADGVYNGRLQNIAVTLHKVQYVMSCLFGDPKSALPPLQKLSAEDLLAVLWKGEGSFVEELLLSMTPHVGSDLVNDLKCKIHAHDPSHSDDLQQEIKKSLLWLRDEIRNLPCTYNCRHDGAADLIHLYAYTKCFFKVQEYKSVKSPPVYISPLDLGPKCADKMGSGFQEYCKIYGENYCLGQLIYWHCQEKVNPDCNLARARRGCLSLPDISSFYSKTQKPLHDRVYDSRTLRFMLNRMEKQPQRPWPKDQIWEFKSSPKFFGSPMLDAVINDCPLDKEMVHWLRSRSNVFHGS